jgi:hypothetical protein
MKQQKILNSKNSLEEHIVFLRAEWEKSKWLRIQIDNEQQRTNAQNAALHLYCKLLRIELNERGLDIRKVLEHKIDIPWTDSSVKEYLWKETQKTLIQKKSTTEANRVDYSLVYETINRYTTEHFGIYLPWPSKERNTN